MMKEDISNIRKFSFYKTDIEKKHMTNAVVHRHAARAIIINPDPGQHTILLIHSQKNGDYKFPGGGVEHNESLETALIREVREETGYRLKKKLWAQISN